MTTVTQTVFDTHVKTHKVTPGQQVNLLIYFLGLRLLLPKLTLTEYLEGALRVAGATKDNMLFPKDALDHYCPNKDSAWEPSERVDMMLTYLNLQELLAAEPAQDINLTFAQFLSTEAEIYKAGDAAAAQVAATETPPAVSPAIPAAGPMVAPPGMTAVPVSTPAPTRTRRTAAGAPTYEAGTDCSYRAPNGPVIAGRIASVINGMYAFVASTGELIGDIRDPSLFEPLEDVPPESPPPQHAVQLRLSPADATEFASILAGAANPAIQIGEVLKTVECQLAPDLLARFDVLNAQPRPTIDAYVFRGTETVADVPSREMSIIGTYDFTINNIIHRVEVLV